ncbi:unnamed protein product, partial [marine sediment metagenome]
PDGLIKDLYEKKAQFYHPDHNLGKEKEATEKFKRLQNAYEVICKARGIT